MESNEINYGINFLRIILCFLVIMNHCFNVSLYNETNIFYQVIHFLFIARSYAVPCFMIIAFFYSANIFLNGENEKLVRRMHRLLLPYFVWGVVAFVMHNLYSIVAGKEILGVERLVLQLFLGHSVNNALWFQFSLITLSLGSFVLFKYVKYPVGVLSFFAVTCLFFEYSGIYLGLCKLPFDICVPIGRLIEMIPCATIGIIFYKYRLFDLFKRYRIIIGFLCVFIGIQTYRCFFIPQGFGYAGIDLLIISLCIVTLFYLLPSNKMSRFVKVIINWLSKYSMGVYCIHLMINAFVKNFIMPGSFTYCLIIYILSLFCTYVISLLPMKWCKQIVI